MCRYNVSTAFSSTQDYFIISINNISIVCPLIIFRLFFAKRALATTIKISRAFFTES